jgi:hypothetical protein
MGKRIAKTYNEAMAEIVDVWQRAGGEWPAPTDEIARFAIDRHLWEPRKGDLVKQCANELAKAMREVYITDPQGRSVRALHAARYSEEGAGRRGQKVFWDDIRTATREHMENAFQLRRRQIVGDCWQLKTDGDSFNDNHPDASPIPLVFDFTPDLEEMEQPSEYDPGQIDD